MVENGAGRKRPLQEESAKEGKKKKGRKQSEVPEIRSLEPELPLDVLVAANAAAATPNAESVEAGKKVLAKEDLGSAAPKLKKRGLLDGDGKPAGAPAVTPVIMRPSSASLKPTGMQVYWNLASVDSTVREQAAATLISELAKEQEGVQIRDNTAGSGKGLISGCASGVQYAVRRLVRGLGSGNKGARQGFALALSQVLSIIPSVSGKSLLELIEKELDLSAAKGQDARDVYLGRIFAHGAIVRSHHLIGAAQSEEQISLAETLVGATLELGGKKSFLREAAAQVVLELLQRLPPSAVEHLLTAEQSALALWLSQGPEGASPESLLVALRLWQWGKLTDSARMMIPLLPTSGLVQDFFNDAHLEKLLEDLKGASHSHPRLHSVWYAMSELLFGKVDGSHPATAKKSKKKNTGEVARGPAGACGSSEVASFWGVVVDKGLLVSKSHERKALAMELLRTLLLPHLVATDIPSVLSPRFMRCLLDNLRDRSSMLQKEALRLLQDLLSWVGDGEDSSLRRVALLTALQSHSGGAFDKVTKTNTVKKLVQGLDSAGWQQYLSSVKRDFLTPDQSGGEDEADEEAAPSTSGPASESKRMWALEQMVAVCRQTQGTPKERLRLIMDTAEFLAVAGLFETEDMVDGPGALKGLANKGLLSRAMRDAAAQRMLSLLSDAIGIAGKAKQASKGTKGTGVEEGAGDPLADIGRFVERVESLSGAVYARELTEEDREAMTHLRSLIKKIDKKSSGAEGAAVDQLSSLRALAVQLQFATLLEPGSAGEIAVELEGVFKGAFLKSAKDDAGIPYMDVLVDVLLSLLARPSASVREAVEQVFKAFSSDLTPTGLADLLRVLRRQPGLKRWKKGEDAKAGDGDLDSASDAEDDVLSEEDEEEDADEGEDEAEGGANAGEEGGEEANGETTNGADEASEGDEAGPSGAGSDSDSADFSDMDDDTMFRVDKALAAVLRESKKERARTGKGGEKSRAEARLHFQYRVLALLDCFLKRNGERGLVLQALLPLVGALQRAIKVGAEGAPLAEKLQAVLKSRFFEGGPKYPRGDEVDVAGVRELLARSFKHASSSHNGKVAAAAGGASLYFIKVLNGRPPGFERSGDADVAALFRAAFQAFFDRRSRLSRSFFQEAFQRHPWLARAMLGDLLDQCEAAKSEFRRVEAMQLLVAVLKNKSSQPKAGRSKAEAGPSSSSVGFVSVPDALEPRRAQLDHLLAAIPRETFTKVSRKAEALKFVCACLGALPRLYPDSELQQLVTPGAIIGAAQKAKEADPDAKKLTSLLDNVIALAGAGRKKAGKGAKNKGGTGKQDRGEARNGGRGQHGEQSHREGGSASTGKSGADGSNAEKAGSIARNGAGEKSGQGVKRERPTEDAKAAVGRIEHLRAAKAAKSADGSAGRRTAGVAFQGVNGAEQPKKKISGDVRRRLKAIAKKGAKAGGKKTESKKSE